MASVFDLIAGTYVTIYARAADPQGAEFWANKLGFSSLSAASLGQATIEQANQLGKQFYAVSKLAFDTKYPTSMIDAAFIDNVYKNLGGLAADPEGAAFWGNRLNALEATHPQQEARSMVAAEIAYVLQTFDPNATGDAKVRSETYKNKLAISQATATTDNASFNPKTQSVNDPAYKGLTDVLNGVDNTNATREIALAQVGAANKANDPSLMVGVPETFTLTEAIALAEAGKLPESYFLLDTKTDLGSNLTVAQEAAKAAQAQQIIDDALNAGSLGKLEASYTLQDTLANVANASNAVIAGASSYSLLDAVAVIEGQQTVAVAQAEVARLQSLVNGASNKGLVLEAGYEIADTLANIEANLAFVQGAQAYTLTNEPGSLGPLTPAQIAIVEGAADAADYTWDTGARLTQNQDNVVGEAGTDHLVVNGSLTDAGLQTFQSWDKIDGGQATKATIDAQIRDQTTLTPTLSNIQHINLQDATEKALPAFITLNLQGLSTLSTGGEEGPGLTLNGNANGTHYIINNIGNVPEVRMEGTNGASFEFNNAGLAGADDHFSVDLHANGMHPGLTADSLIIKSTVGPNALETLHLNLHDSDSRFTNISTGGAGVETIHITGNGNLRGVPANGDLITIVDATGTTKNIDASELDGGISVSVLGNSTVSGGLGDDHILAAGGGQNNFQGNAGNDLFQFNGNLMNTDVIVGGEGVDSLGSFWANLVGYAVPVVHTITGIEHLIATSPANGGILDTTKFGVLDNTIMHVSLAGGSTAASTINFAPGAAIVDIGLPDLLPVPGNPTLGGQLNVTNNGLATTDSLAINNNSELQNGLGNDGFNGQVLNTAGFETVTVDTGIAGATGGAANTFLNTVDIGQLNLAGSAGAATTALFVGENNANFWDVTAGRGTINARTIDASGLSNGAGLWMNANELTATGPATIIGSSSKDILVSDANGATILGNGGGDYILGSNNSVDTIDAGADNDWVSVTWNALSNPIPPATAAQISGGVAGIDTLEIVGTSGFLPAVNLSGISNFEILDVRSTAFTNVRMTDFVSNAGFDTLVGEGAGVQFSNVSANVDTFGLTFLSAGSNFEVDRLVDTTSNSITVANVDWWGANGNQQPAVFSGLAAAAAATTLTLNDEETITLTTDYSNPWTGLTTSAGLTVATLAAADLTTLNINGTGAAGAFSNVGVGFINSPFLSTVNASGLQGSFAGAAVNNGVVGSTVNLTFTAAVGQDSVDNGFAAPPWASFRADGLFANVFTSGSGNDTLNGSAFADYLDGWSGSDSINGAGGRDYLVGGTGADSVTTGAGSDEVQQGLTDSRLLTLNASSVANSFSVNDTLQFANGVDVVTDFAAGLNGDVLLTSLGGAAVPNAALNGASAAMAQGVYYLSGNWNGSQFTVTQNGTGNATMVFQVNGTNAASQNILTNASIVILQGVGSGLLVPTNFNSFVPVPVITGTVTGTAYAVTNTEIVNGTVTVDATLAAPAPGNITTTDTVATVTYSGAFTPATITSIDVSGVASTGTPVTVNVDGTVNTALSALNGNAAGTNFAFVGGALDLGTAAAATTVTGGAATDSITFTTALGAVAAPGLGAGFVGGVNYGTFTSIENINFAAGTSAAVNISALAGPVAVNNTSGTAAATVVLGAVAGQSYTSVSAGIDTVTLGAAGQSVSLGGGNGVINTTALQTVGSSFGGGLGADVLNVAYDATLGRAVTLGGAGAGFTGIETVNATLTAASQVLNITPDAALGAATVNFAGAFAETLNGTGGTITVGQVATQTLALGGTSNFIVSGGTTGAITSTSTGTLAAAVTDSQTITSTGGAVTVDATALAGGETLTIGTANTAAFTVNNVGTTGGDIVTEGVGNTGAITVNATSTNNFTITEASTVAAGTAGSVVLNHNGTGTAAWTALGAHSSHTANLLVGSADLTMNLASTAGVTVTGTDDNGGHVINTTNFADTITITNLAAATGAQTINAFGGNDTVNLTTIDGTSSVIGGAGNDGLTGGTAANRLYGDNNGTFTTETYTVGAGAISAGETFTATINGIASTYTAVVTDTTLTVATGLASAITTNVALGGIVASAVGAAGVVTVTYLVDSATGGVASDTSAAVTLTQLTTGGTNGSIGNDALVGGAANDLFYGGLGVDTISVGGGTDVVLYRQANDSGAQTTVGAFTGSSGFDKISGLAAGDVINLGFVNGSLAVAASTTLVNGVDNQAVFVRGNDVGGVFTASATGTDTLLVYDANIAGGGAVDYHAVVLTGFVGSANAVNSVLTLT